MTEASLDDFLKDNHDAILVAVQAKVRGDEAMQKVAAHSELSESDLSSQVLGFWLQGIRSDLALGSPATMKQSMTWLASMRAGQEIPFDDTLVLTMFDDLSAEIEARLEEPALRDQYAAYRAEVTQLISDAFPACGEAS